MDSGPVQGPERQQPALPQHLIGQGKTNIRLQEFMGERLT
jgi:hypothetical protein